MIDRLLAQRLKKSIKNNKSVLLLGPRQTGKSTLAASLQPSLTFNLANESTFLEFVRDSSFLESTLKAKNLHKGLIFIDEVQRLSSLLNTIQYLIDKNKQLQFVLSGSSARKLKRGKANLLPGRVHFYQLGPIVSGEMNFAMTTEKILRFGSLPEAINENDSKQLKMLLKSYAQIYLNEEIKAEALTKNIEGFARFLYAMAADSTKYIDLSKISSQIAVPRQTTQRFFEILEDTLIIKRCDAFAKSDKKRIVQHPRFYFFDNGVLNGLLNNYNCSEDRLGYLFENLFFNQLSTSLNYDDRDYRLSTYRTSAGAEVDLILELEDKIFAIECKTGYVKKSNLGGFSSFEDFLGKKVRKIVVTPNDQERTFDSIEVMNWQKFLKRL